jgi:hypothetical protein
VHKDIKKIQWISQWRQRIDFDVGKNLKKNNLTWEHMLYKPDNFALKVIEKFCINNSLSLEIISVSGYEDEYDYYLSMVKKFKFSFTNKNIHPLQNYKLISDDAIIAGRDSQLVYESLSRNYRTALFPLSGFYTKNKSFTFGWPLKTSDCGKFWSNIPDEDKISNVLQYLKEVNRNEWIQEAKKYKGMMIHNRGNSIIKSKLKNLSVYINEE